MTAHGLRRLLPLALVALLLVAAGLLAWRQLQPDELGEGFARGNGRLEATEIDVATKLAGRIARIEVDEGDFVAPGDILAQMDTEALNAQLDEARAQVRQAANAIQTAHARVAQRESEKATAEAMVSQRQAELAAAQKRYQRTEALVRRSLMSRQQLDDDLAGRQSAEAALAAARAQVHSAQAAIDASRSEVIGAESTLQAAEAAVARLQADLADSQLKATRQGRVQYRVAQPGEVLAAGGRVLNLIDIEDVYMTFFLPTAQAGRVALGSEARIVLDAAPQYVIPARITHVANVAQFTPKTVETQSEREKLMFRIKATIAPELLRKYREEVKTGLPGVAYVRLDAETPWPERLKANVAP